MARDKIEGFNMMIEEDVKQELEKQFAFLKGSVMVKRRGRIFVEVALEKFKAVFVYAVQQMRFEGLSAITGLDSGNGFSIIYHLNREGAVLLNLNVGLDKERPEVDTVTTYFPGADIYERELVDLLGIKVNGLSQGHRYPLPDNWPGDEHPLRKDWKGSSKKKEVPHA